MPSTITIPSASRRRAANATAAWTSILRSAQFTQADLTGTDVALLLAGIQHTAAPLLAAEPQAWRRYLELALDGMTAHPERGLPHPPPSRLPLNPNMGTDPGE